MPCYEVQRYCLRDHRIGDGDNAETVPRCREKCLNMRVENKMRAAPEDIAQVADGTAFLEIP